MADDDATKPAADPAAARKTEAATGEADAIEELKRRSDRYGAGFAVASEAFNTPGANSMVLGAKIVIAVIVVYALGSALWVGLFGG